MTDETILGLLYRAADEFNDEHEDDDLRVAKSPDTVLLGEGGSLNSLGLVSYIMIVEDLLEDRFDCRHTLADERALSQTHSPFRTVGRLADYIETLVHA